MNWKQTVLDKVKEALLFFWYAFLALLIWICAGKILMACGVW